MAIGKRRSSLALFVVATLIGAVVFNTRLSGIAQVPAPPLGGPFQPAAQNETSGQCNGQWGVFNGRQCDSFQFCSPTYRCAILDTPCGNVVLPRRRTINNIAYGFCQPATYNRQCKECQGQMICEIIRGYAGVDAQGNCVGACDLAYKKVIDAPCK